MIEKQSKLFWINMIDKLFGIYNVHGYVENSKLLYKDIYLNLQNQLMSLGDDEPTTFNQ